MSMSIAENMLARKIAECSALRKECAELRAERDEIQGVFDRHYEIEMTAIKRWQKAHPGNDLVWPDKTEMVQWMMDQIDRVGP